MEVMRAQHTVSSVETLLAIDQLVSSSEFVITKCLCEITFSEMSTRDSPEEMQAAKLPFMSTDSSRYGRLQFIHGTQGQLLNHLDGFWNKDQYIASTRTSSPWLLSRASS